MGNNANINILNNRSKTFITDFLRLSFVIYIRYQHLDVIKDCRKAGHNNFLFLLQKIKKIQTYY